MPNLGAAPHDWGFAKKGEALSHKEATPYYLIGSKRSANELGYPHTEVGRPAGGAVCGGEHDVHAGSPARCVPNPEQCASHICHRS